MPPGTSSNCWQLGQLSSMYPVTSLGSPQDTNTRQLLVLHSGDATRCGTTACFACKGCVKLGVVEEGACAIQTFQHISNILHHNFMGPSETRRAKQFQTKICWSWRFVYCTYTPQDESSRRVKSMSVWEQGFYD